MMATMAAIPGKSADDQSCWVTLIAKVAQGDERSLANLYDALSRVVYGMALRIVREASAAEEITLEVFMQVWRTASSYDASRGTVPSWLATLARSRSVDWLRSPHARFSRQCRALEDSPEAGDFSPNPEHASLQAGRDRIIRKSMGQLPPEQRQAIELAYFSGFSHSEIAGRLGVPLGTVKARIRLGISHLRESLVPYVEAGL